MSIQYIREALDFDPTLSDADLNSDGLIVRCQKNTTGAPTATPNKFIRGAIVQNAFSGVVYVNTGTVALPVFGTVTVV